MVQNIILYLYNFVILEMGIDLCFAIFVTKFSQNLKLVLC